MDIFGAKVVMPPVTELTVAFGAKVVVRAQWIVWREWSVASSPRVCLMCPTWINVSWCANDNIVYWNFVVTVDHCVWLVEDNEVTVLSGLNMAKDNVLTVC